MTRNERAALIRGLTPPYTLVARETRTGALLDVPATWHMRDRRDEYLFVLHANPKLTWTLAREPGDVA